MTKSAQLVLASTCVLLSGIALAAPAPGGGATPGEIDYLCHRMEGDPSRFEVIVGHHSKLPSNELFLEIIDRHAQTVYSGRASRDFITFAGQPLVFRSGKYTITIIADIAPIRSDGHSYFQAELYEHSQMIEELKCEKTF